MKIKVLFFLQSGVGGAERMTIYIANCLDETKYEVVFYVIGKDTGLIDKFIPESKQRHLIKVDSYRDFLIFKMVNILIKEQPKFVFSSVFPFNYRLCIASILLPKTRVIVRSDNYLYTQSIIQKMRLFIGYRFLDYVITQTEEMREEHIKQLLLKKSKVITCPNPVNKESIDSKLENCQSPFDESIVNYVYVGRIAHVKGLDILLQAFAEVLLHNSNSLLHVVGDITGIYKVYYEQLLEMVDDLGIKDKVVFLGFSFNPYQYMKFANCFVLPSRNEGLPNVMIESLYLGTPVAVTDCIPVIKRIVREGVDGYVSNVDDVSGLAKIMIKSTKLGRIVSSYNSATKKDFEKLFI